MLDELSRLRYHMSEVGVLGGISRAVFKITRNRVGGAVSSLHSLGEPVYERNWDVLIVLDSCRYDLMKELSNEHSLLETDIGSITSVGSTSVEWMQKTFCEEFSDEMEETAYITANPHSHSQVDPKQFDVLDEVWRYGWDDELGTVSSRTMTDRTLSTWSERSPSRLIAHYMQPHYPFLSDLDLQPREGQSDIWMSLREGDFSNERVWNAYRKNLKHALDEVELLVESIDADLIVATSDHGNAVGEFGMYGHPPGFPLNCLRKVPWIELEGAGPGDYKPDTYDETTKSKNGW